MRAFPRYLVHFLHVSRMITLVMMVGCTQLILGCKAIEDVGKGVGDVLVGAVEEVGKVGKDIFSFPQEVDDYDKQRTEVARLLQEKEQLKEQIEDKENPPPDPRNTLPKIKDGAW